MSEGLGHRYTKSAVWFLCARGLLRFDGKTWRPEYTNYRPDQVYRLPDVSGRVISLAGSEQGYAFIMTTHYLPCGPNEGVCQSQKVFTIALPK